MVDSFNTIIFTNNHFKYLTLFMSKCHIYKWLSPAHKSGGKGSHKDGKGHSHRTETSFKKGGSFKKGDSGGHATKGHDVSKT